jgi:hypothetical protein
MTMFSVEMYQSQSDQRVAEATHRFFAVPDSKEQRHPREDYIISLQETMAIKTRREGSAVKFTPRFEE